MLVLGDRDVSIMVLFAIALHLIWAFLIITDDAALGATGVDSIHRYIAAPWLVAATILMAALLATIGLLTHRPLIVLFLLPQQILLMMSSAGAIEAIWLAQFADGVVRPRAFIAADQMYSILAAIGHTIAIIAHANRIVR